MEVVLRRIRISGKRSQEHQEEQQPKKAKNNDEEMDVGKIVDEEDDGYQPNKKQSPWDTEDEEVSRCGEILEQELVQMAKEEELDNVEKFGVYKDATIEECFVETGRAPVGTKWVDVDKGTAENPNIPCRLVARDVQRKGVKDRADFFASMPPLEAKKVLISIAATHEKEFCRGRWQRPKLMFIAVKKAHLTGRLNPDDVAFVQLPGSPPGTCSRPKRWLYGMRQAASA